MCTAEQSGGAAMNECVTIGTLEEYISCLPREEGRYLYRGEDMVHELLVPRLLRSEIFSRLQDRYKLAHPIDIQAELLRRFRRYASHYHLGGGNTEVSPEANLRPMNGCAWPSIMACQPFCSTGPLTPSWRCTSPFTGNQIRSDVSG